MAVPCGFSAATVPSQPEYPDLNGKRRETARVEMLERQIGFLEEELKSVESLQLASTFCKEVADFVVANTDPLIPTNKKNHRWSRFWKRLCGSSCCCCHDLQTPRCCNPCDCCLCSCSAQSCTAPDCKCTRLNCLRKVSCQSSSCPDWCLPKCRLKMPLCCSCYI